MKIELEGNCQSYVRPPIEERLGAYDFTESRVLEARESTFHWRGIMENHNVRLFRVIVTLNFLVFLSSTGVISAPTTVETETIMDVMKNDTSLCPASKVLYDSKYVKLCNSQAYPKVPWNYMPETLNQFLCLGIYDTAYKICQYSSSQQIPHNSTIFDSHVEKFLPFTSGEEKKFQKEKFCRDNLQDFVPLYNKIGPMWEPMVKSLKTLEKCAFICFHYDNKFHPPCAVLAWIKNIDDNVRKSNKTGINEKHDNTFDVETSNIKNLNQPSDKISKDKNAIPTSVMAENQKSEPKSGVEADITKPEVTHARTKIDDTKENKLNISDLLSEHMSSEVQVHDQVTQKVSVKNSVSISGPQEPPVDHAAGDVIDRKIVNKGNTVDSDKKQEVTGLKATTLSENTQNDDVVNADEDVQSNIVGDTDDAVQDDTISQIDTVNRNENQPGSFESKNNLQYSKIRIEEDSHFFTYFTVIILACIIGYIGYHNKQKILAIVLEGRRSRSNRGRRRPSTASYRKLDCTLEEAVTSQCNANVTHVIY